MNIITGAGISGATVARVLAERGENVLVIERRPYTGGNCADHRDGGILVHRFGPHIFHTESERVWKFLGRFTAWHPYLHRVAGVIDGQFVPVPFNLTSLRMLFPACLADSIERRLVERFGFGGSVPVLELRRAPEPELHLLADYVYEKLFLPYTMKQWGVAPEDIDASVTARVPVRVSRDDRYFTSRRQGLPLQGYDAMIRAMLDPPNIEVQTGVDAADLKAEFTRARVFFTGALDELMDMRFGPLPWRSARLEFFRLPGGFHQSHAVVNYPENHDFTRICEYRRFYDAPAEGTVISLEYPEPWEEGKNERFYPVPGADNERLYRRYLEAARAAYPDFHALGRLGDYRYYDMDRAVERALDLAENL